MRLSDETIDLPWQNLWGWSFLWHWMQFKHDTIWHDTLATFALLPRPISKRTKSCPAAHTKASSWACGIALRSLRWNSKNSNSRMTNDLQVVLLWAVRRTRRPTIRQWCGRCLSWKWGSKTSVQRVYGQSPFLWIETQHSSWMLQTQRLQSGLPTCQILEAGDIRSCVTDLASLLWRAIVSWQKAVPFAISLMWRLQSLISSNAEFLQLFPSPLCWQQFCRICDSVWKISNFMDFTTQQRLSWCLSESLSFSLLKLALTWSSNGFQKSCKEWLSQLLWDWFPPSMSKELYQCRLEHPWSSSGPILPFVECEWECSIVQCRTWTRLDEVISHLRLIFPTSVLGIMRWEMTRVVIWNIAEGAGESSEIPQHQTHVVVEACYNHLSSSFTLSKQERMIIKVYHDLLFLSVIGEDCAIRLKTRTTTIISALGWNPDLFQEVHTGRCTEHPDFLNS